MSIPRIVIAGTNSGCGKTTVSTGIMGTLTAKGLRVQPFKVGPDYIDPMFHTFITGNASRNLDSWMLDESTVAYLFSRNTGNADIAVVEGVMGMYDGYGGYSDGGSTAHVARIVGAPVILVVNGEGMSLSIVPLIKGFMDFDRDAKVRGVIINNINSEAHFRMLKEMIEEHLGISVLGYLKSMPEVTLASRHLGLVPEGEIKDLRQKIDLLTEELRKTVDLELLLKIAAEGVTHNKIADESFEKDTRFAIKPLPPGARIAVAKDKAFNFYYRDNLDLLEMLGAELVYFSPLGDTRLPDGINGLYLGGGYPEVFAAQLEENVEMRECIKNRISEGLPTYAECGGFMYLSEGIINGGGEKFDMAGVIPGLSKMTGSLQRFGYIEIDVVEDNILAARGDKIRAHEFHYSVTEVEGGIPACFSIKKSRRNGEARIWKCGYKLHNLLAGYPHLHFWSNPGFAGRFVENCLRFGAKV
ncbi:MAG TPA: cobyrinate a,c-diamide synthase [Clostridiaceae bacterium]|nr:cobyrinate a,c-diamide synthase [Clostridiaceae bacterium]